MLFERQERLAPTAVIRTNVLRSVALQDSYHNSDRTWTAELALHGPFYQVPDYLYFRRDHRRRAPEPDRAQRCAILDQRRAGPLAASGRPPVGSTCGGICLPSIARRSPSADRRECYLWLARWMAGRAVPDRAPLGEPISVRQPVAPRGGWAR